MTRRALMVGLIVLVAALAAPALAQVAQISGSWTGLDWGTIELRADGTGTYSSTYGPGAGRMAVRSIGPRRFAGTWGESSQRHGTFTFELAADGRTILGSWTPDPGCTIGTMTGGELTWTRR